MANCRFLHTNYLDDPAALTLSSAEPGLVGMPAARALGGAACYATGRHTGAQEQVFLVEIDSVAAGEAVGQATFRWRRADADTWEAAGLATSPNLSLLADGVSVKWVSGQGPDFVKGDSWRILAVRGAGSAALVDGDRDTAWQAAGCAGEHLTADLGQARRVRAMVLADHNLTAGASARLLASEADFWRVPAWGADLTASVADWPADASGTQSRGTVAWCLDADGVWREAAAGVGRIDHQGGRPRYLHEPQRTNKLTVHNAAPDGVTGMTRYGDPAAVLTVADDPAALAAAGLDQVCAAGRAWRLDNSAGAAAASCQVPGAVGNQNPHVLSAWVRGGCGRLMLGSGGVDGEIAFGAASGYRRVVSAPLAPSSTGRVMYLEADPGQVVWFILPQLEEGASVTSPIVTAGAAASRAADGQSWPLGQAMRDLLPEEGILQVEVVSAGVAHGGDVVTLNPSYYPLLYWHTGGSVRTHNGVTTASCDLNWAAGTPYLLAVRWSAARDQVQVGVSADGGAAWSWGGAAAFAGCPALDEAGRLHIGWGMPVPLWVGRLAVAAAWLEEADLGGFFLGRVWDLEVTEPHLVHFLDHESRFWRLELADPDNPQGALAASGWRLGDYFEPAHSFQSRYTRSATAGRTVTATDAGKVAGSASGLAESLRLSFPRLGAADVAAFRQVLVSVHDAQGGALRPLVFTPFADQPADSLICLPGPGFSFQRMAADRWSLELTLEEVVKTDA